MRPKERVCCSAPCSASLPGRCQAWGGHRDPLLGQAGGRAGAWDGTPGDAKNPRSSKQDFFYRKGRTGPIHSLVKPLINHYDSHLGDNN